MKNLRSVKLKDRIGEDGEDFVTGKLIRENEGMMSKDGIGHLYE